MVENKILISVVVPCYNSEKTIDDCLESIISQTYKNLEIILIDDGSIDDTLSKIKDFNDNRIKIQINTENIGITKSLNIGLKLSKGKYILRIDSDDIAHPELAENLFNFLNNNPDYIACGANMLQFPLYNEIKYIEKNEELKISTLFKSPFSHSCVLFRNNLQHNLFYDPYFEYVEDYELWTRISKLGKFYNVQKYLLYYRVSELQITKRSDYNFNRNRLLERVHQKNANDFFNLSKENEIYYSSLILGNKIDVSPIKFINLYSLILSANFKNNYFNQFLLKKSFSISIVLYLSINYSFSNCIIIFFYNPVFFFRILKNKIIAHINNTRRKT